MELANIPENVLVTHYIKPVGTHAAIVPSKRMLQGIATYPMEIDHTGEQLQSFPKSPIRLSEKQFSALYHAVASGSGWWPLADERWKSREYFDRLEKYVLCLDNLPVGFAALDRESDGPNKTRVVFIGIIPAMQGMRYGNLFFNQMEELIRFGVSGIWGNSVIAHPYGRFPSDK